MREKRAGEGDQRSLRGFGSDVKVMNEIYPSKVKQIGTLEKECENARIVIECRV